jgi:methionyl aminopeptidase
MVYRTSTSTIPLRHLTLTISRPLLPEDIINIDLTLFHLGVYGDTSRTFLLPDVDKPGRELVEATQESLELGIQACGPGRRYSDIGRAIEWVS